MLLPVQVVSSISSVVASRRRVAGGSSFSGRARIWEVSVKKVLPLGSGGPASPRLYGGEEDWWRVRDLLVLTFATAAPEWNWEPRRWDGARFYGEPPRWSAHWDDCVRLWETGDGRLVGAVHPDGPGDAALQMHPDYRHIEEEMVAWAEVNLSRAPGEGERPQVETLVWDYDVPRRRLLANRGWEETPHWSVARRLRLGQKVIPPSVMPPGYNMRQAKTDDEDECEQIAALLNAAFGRTFHNGAELMNFRRLAPTFRAELDLYAVAADGSLAANAGGIYIEEAGIGFFEPVCTHPGHREKGLAQALMWEAMRRMRELGAHEVRVATGSMEPANRLYESVGFDEMYTGHVWRKFVGS